jgi:hypothetical protein
MKRAISVRIGVAFTLVLLFLAGGVLLDYQASLRWVVLQPHTDSQTNQAVVDLAKKGIENLNTSARMLYDIAKVTLGVLLALLGAGVTGALKRKDEGAEPGATTAAPGEKPTGVIKSGAGSGI